jgi:uncharacterized protein YvpB
MEKPNPCLIKALVFLVCFLIFSVLFVLLDNYLFVLISPPKVINLSSEEGEDNISLDSPIIIKFNKPIKRREIQPSISPEVHGEWKFEDPLIVSSKDPLIKTHLCKTLIFVPAIDFKPDTQYQVKLENIKGFGFDKSNSFQFAFKTAPAPPEAKEEENSEDTKIQEQETETFLEQETSESQPEVTMLKIALDWQDHNLSCEAASLKMALAGKGVFLSEEQIMEKIDYDLTSRKGDIWGDPYQKYVGNIDGKICKTGFGVFWEPVAKAAQNWREAEAFSGWTIEDLIQEIADGNPVVFWGVLPTGTLNDCSWHTPEGKFILAFKETHVRLAVGFIGPQNNPSQIIINDPLSGRLYWSTSYFFQNWSVFNRSGVVVR